MPQDIVEPLNSIIVADEGLVIEEFRIGVTADPLKTLPGTWVIADTIDGTIMQAGALAVGVIGIIIESATGSLTTPYAVGASCRVVTGGDGLVLSRVAIGGGNIIPGTPIVTAADGLAQIQKVGIPGAEGEIVALGETIHANDGGSVTNAVVRIHHEVLDY
jgi:hypothetical protein